MVNRKELNPDAGPAAAFGARLRSAREARGWNQDEFGVRIGYSGRHVSGVETGHKPPTRRFSLATDTALGLEGTDDSFERAWRDLRHGVLLQGFPEYVRLEGRAVEIKFFEVGVIPGLLQTSAYAQALDASAVARGAITPDQAEERLSLLLDRQAALMRPVPPLVVAVLDESCVRRPVGGATAMDAQLQHLVDFAERPNTMLQLAPYSMGEHRPFNRAVNLLTLADRSVVSYVESQTRGHLDRELASAVPLMRDYHQLQAMSLSQTASVDMIHQLRKGTS
ncbi:MULTISPECIES: helix-turn-helix domain-containing protein [Streptomyces]|uniref:helix-turn-helix domain-containing protein n=2 Tax=Streptomyces TaxID=1883 RepID=UPI00048F5F12|nr:MULTISPECIES: helix-turn-helix transcriptional regulator [Streptomyces]MYY15731.1 helix-turn-helix domain-containing protein [Streptomyces sp. SID4912]SCD60389.1 Helix-turn-helix domain-containing protein [Streptomyces sp. DpondAA-D4]